MTGLEQDAALIRDLLAHSGVTAAEIAREAGVDPKTIQRPAKGTAETRLSQRTLEKLQIAYPDYPGWAQHYAQALNAHVTDLRDETATAASAHADWVSHDRRDVNPDLVELDQIDLRYGMGGTYTDGPVEVEKRAFSREWLQSITSTAPRHLFWATGDGDSMEPTIRSGEIVLIDRSQETPRVDDAIWAVVDGEIGMIKRMRHHSDGTVELLSDNQLVPPRRTADDELHIIGRVIAVVRRL
ncbi:S24 family peptidase [Parasphingorhabdus sp.]|uniref:S24 family peptidase n=1 Tax=Parasphingorhabdus sp. TaxID=2709688 RepID=UPI00300374F0